MKTKLLFLSQCLMGVAPLFVGASLRAAPLTWFPGTALNEPRNGAATVFAPGGGILLFGGNPLRATNVLVYGSADVLPLPSTRIAPGAVALSSGFFYVYGGKQTSASNSVTSSVLSYYPVFPGPNPENDPIFPVSPMSTRRYDLGYASDAAGHAYAIGGLGNNNGVLASVERYDPVSDTWSNMASLPAGTYHFGAVFDGTNTIYTFGGRTNATAGTETATVLSYSVSANAWSALPSMPVATAGSAAILGVDGKLYVIGGTAGGVVTNLVQVYDPGSSTWVLSTPLPAAVTAAGGAVDSLGRLVVLGGADGNGADLATTWVSQELNQPDAAPVFTFTKPPTAVYQVPYTFTPLVSGSPPPTFQLITAPAGMTEDYYTGQLTWTPQADQLGANVVAIAASNYSGSVTQSYTINATGPTPAAPTNVVASYLGVNSVTLSWDSVIPVIGSVTYTIYYRYVTGGKGGSHAYYAVFVSGIPSTSVTISGLLEGSSHTYAVSAVAAGAESARSVDVSFTTLRPQPPANVQVTALTSTSITLVWDPSPGPLPVASYEVWGWTDGGVTSQVFGTGITNTTLTINGLVPGTSHEWGVRTHDVAGNVSYFGFANGGQFFVNPVAAPAAVSSLVPLAGGGFQFMVQQAGSPETTFIQATTTPADPASWLTIATNPPTSSTYIFTDPDASLFPMRFYRVVSP
jgi:hypothetical protein